MDSYGNVTFREVQRFSQKWLWALVVLDAVWIAGVVAVLGMPHSTQAGQPPKATVLQIIVIAALTSAGVLGLILMMNLTTEVRTDGLYIRFFPMHLSWRKIPLENLTKCEVRTYNPIREYGGWGIRGTQKNRAYNVSGNLGVQFEYGDGDRLLIGSQEPEELLSSLQDANLVPRS